MSIFFLSEKLRGTLLPCSLIMYVSWFCQPVSNFHINVTFLCYLSHNASLSVDHTSEYLKTVNDWLFLVVFVNNSLILNLALCQTVFTSVMSFSLLARLRLASGRSKSLVHRFISVQLESDSDMGSGTILTIRVKCIIRKISGNLKGLSFSWVM